MEALFRTGYPHPINVFVALMLLLLPALTPLAGTTEGHLREPSSYGLAGGLALVYLLVWSRVRVQGPARSNRFYQVYLFTQTIVVSLIYILDGDLTRFLFVVVAVQAVYVTPVRRWAPSLGTLGALWLTLYLVISPQDPNSNKVAVIGMYLLYLIFAALITFTTVQQERQVQIARELLIGVNERHAVLKAYDLTVARLAEVEERERLAQGIYSELRNRLTRLMAHLERLQQGALPLTRRQARGARMDAKEVLSSIREAVRTLRPNATSELDDEDESTFGSSPEPEASYRKTDPLRIYHVWNIGVIVITTGVMVASDLVGGTARWALLLVLGLALMAAYGGTATATRPMIRSLCLVMQAGLCAWIIWLSQEPLMSHLLLIVAAQIVFLVPLLNRWLAAAVGFPTLLSAAALWSTGLFIGQTRPFLSLTAAFGVNYFFGAIMAFMTRRQVEARQQALSYAGQMAQVNRQLESRLHEVHRMAIARERIRMAREIHDGLGHHLTTVIVELQHAEQLAEEDSAAATQHIQVAREVITEALKASSEMVESLERFERPLVEALSELVDAWRVRSGVAVTLSVSGGLDVLSTAASVTLYRAVQESLTNIQKHAMARSVRIVLERHPDRVCLIIANDETGGTPRGVAGKGGFGLVGLRERAETLQGEFEAGARAEGGFCVKLVLPLGV